MVVAGDMVVGSDMLSVTSAEPDEVAGALEAVVAEAATTVGVWPATLIVRREAVADILRSLLRPRGCSVEVAPALRELDPVAAELVLHLSGSDTWPAVRPPETWAAWGLPEAMVASLFRAYAAFYRAAPWRWLDDYPPVLAEWDDGTGPWTVSVMGAALGEYGLGVYSQAEDLVALAEKFRSRLRAPEGGIFSWSEGGLTLRYLNPPEDVPETGPLPTPLAETDGTPATAAGNLKRAFVAEMVEQMRFQEGYLDQLFRRNKVVNEEDVGTLHVLRVNLEVGGLLKRRKGRFTLTRKGKELAKPDQVGRLFLHLFRTYFGRFNIAYGSRGVVGSSLQRAVPILLWQIGARAREWISLRDLAVQVLPGRPGMPPAEDSPERWPEESELRWWVLRPLRGFGLLEERSVGQGEAWYSRPQEIQLRTTPLYEVFLRFEW
jgi:hypothetical protein